MKEMLLGDSDIFQFTPLREGRPCRILLRQGFHCISIHAPPRGATHPIEAAMQSEKNFNSRPSARGDWFPANLKGLDDRISIHAPPRGATKKSGQLTLPALNFNSRPSARGDQRS